MAHKQRVPSSAVLSGMPSCCMCCNTGRCVRCVCACAGTACLNCQPSRQGRCSNLGQSASGIIGVSIGASRNQDMAVLNVTPGQCSERF